MFFVFFDRLIFLRIFKEKSFFILNFWNKELFWLGKTWAEFAGSFCKPTLTFCFFELQNSTFFKTWNIKCYCSGTKRRPISPWKYSDTTRRLENLRVGIRGFTIVTFFLGMNRKDQKNGHTRILSKIWLGFSFNEIKMKKAVHCF